MSKDESRFSERFTVAADQLTDRVKGWIAEGNVRRIIVRNRQGVELVNIPLTGGAVAGGALILAAPLLTAVGAIAAVASPLSVEVVREGDPVVVDVEETVEVAEPAEGGPVDYVHLSESVEDGD